MSDDTIPYELTPQDYEWLALKRAALTYVLSAFAIVTPPPIPVERRLTAGGRERAR